MPTTTAPPTKHRPPRGAAERLGLPGDAQGWFQPFQHWATHPCIRELLHSKLFWGILGLKLVMGTLLASSFMRDLFTPFVNYFVASGFSDPWAHFSSLGRLNSFPYPPLMLYLLAVPRFVFGYFLAAGTDTVTLMHLFVMHLPLLVCDLAVVITLCQWFPGRTAKIVKFYWCSPLVIYVTYWHGQLDIIPTAFFVASLYLLRFRRFQAAMAVFGLALATKTHLFVALPFLLVYLYQESDALKTIRSALVGATVYLLALLPYLFRPAFGRMVFATAEQARVIAFQIPVGADLRILVAPAALLLLWFRFLAYRQRNWDLMMLYFGILFSVFVLFAPAAPGYVLWSLPFLVCFASRGRRNDGLPLVLYSVAYLAFFWIRRGSDLFDAWRVSLPALARIPGPYDLIASRYPQLAALVHDVSFTVMQTSLAGMILFMYLIGVRRNDAYRARTSPVMIGVAGDSGAGKDTFVQLVKEVLGPDRVTAIAGDDYHHWPRGHAMWCVYTHLNVRANDLYKQFQDAVVFSRGQPVMKGTYDHGTGQFTEDRLVDPNEVMIFQGLHTLAIEALRNLYDLKIFLDPQEDVRCFWKVQRDSRHRGHTPAQVLRSLEERQRDRESYILPQMDEAELIIRWKSRQEIRVDDLDALPELELEVLARNTFDLTGIVSQLEEVGNLEVGHTPFQDLRWQSVRLHGTLSQEVVQRIALLASGSALNRGAAPRFRSDLTGCLQLIFLTCLTQKLEWQSSLPN